MNVYFTSPDLYLDLCRSSREKSLFLQLSSWQTVKQTVNITNAYTRVFNVSHWILIFTASELFETLKKKLLKSVTSIMNINKMHKPWIKWYNLNNTIYRSAGIWHYFLFSVVNKKKMKKQLSQYNDIFVKPII